MQHISFATKVVSGKGGGVLRNKAANWRMEDRNLETKFWKTKLGRFTGLGFICGRDLSVGLKLGLHKSPAARLARHDPIWSYAKNGLSRSGPRPARLGHDRPGYRVGQDQGICSMTNRTARPDNFIIFSKNILIN